MDRNKLYLLLGSATAAGYAYLAWAQSHNHNESATLCVIKNVTGLPCPSCGSTRSVLALTKGNINEALLVNPLGFIISLIMVIMPLWLLYDLLWRNESLYKFYRKFEETLNNRWIAIVLSLLVVANWIWNINKGL